MNGTTAPLAALACALVLATSCGDAPTSGDEDGLLVVATTSVLGDVVSNVVGTDAEVEVLTPLGADPHDFRPSASQVARVNRADLVVANGLGLEEGLADVLQAAAGDGVAVLEVGPMLEPIEFEGAGHDDTVGSESAHHGEDPHVWMDPLRMAEAARLIAAGLDEIDPSVDWAGGAGEYVAELERADAEIIETLSAVPADRRQLVTNHDSLGYFAERYDFEVVGVIIPGGSTLGEPSSEELAALVETMREEEVRVLFVETTAASPLADAVADELGADIAVVELFSGSLGEPGSGADTLIGMLTTNAERIAEALGG